MGFWVIQVILIAALVSIHPDFSLPFTLQTYARKYALAGVLPQNSAGEERPVYFVSRTLSKAEGNYTVTEKKSLAVHWSVDRLRGYGRGESLIAITDHRSLI